MRLVVGTILDASQLERLGADLERIEFENGKATAGWAARDVKQNQQAVRDPLAEHWCESIRAHLSGNEIFRLAAQPKRIIGPMLSRYRSGDHYGTHVDDALLDGHRSDLAFTLFLGDPKSYDGGELVLQSSAGDESYKLDAGQLLLYPATTLHRVEPVTRGTRHAAVGWVRSLIRGHDQRELLFDLERARRAIFQQHGRSDEFELLSKCSTNLMRLWCED